MKDPSQFIQPLKYISLNLCIWFEVRVIIYRIGNENVYFSYSKGYGTVHSKDSSWCFLMNFGSINLFNYRFNLDNFGIFLLFCFKVLYKTELCL